MCAYIVARSRRSFQRLIISFTVFVLISTALTMQNLAPDVAHDGETESGGGFTLARNEREFRSSNAQLPGMQPDISGSAVRWFV